MKKESKILILLLFIIANISCDQRKIKQIPNLFEGLPSSYSNITFKNNIPEDEFFNAFKYEYVYDGGGVAVGDINNDGLEDIYFTSNVESNQLYLNKGDLKFENITRISQTQSKKGWTTGTNMIDINNDGLLDIYVCNQDLLPNIKL